RDLGVSAPPGAAGAAGPTVRRAHALATLVVLAGVPLVAAGITISRRLESPAALLLGAGMLVVSALLALAGLRRLLGRGAAPPGPMGSLRARLSGALLLVAALSLVGSMNLAVAFALTGSAGRGAGPTQGLISYSAMATYHGLANAVGFAGCALLAYALAPPARPTTSDTTGAPE
ncbi:MAG TPA: YndJ family transporter, partial [Polyangiaceae bacterium]|nr:YndJ family transporter [Polyangiaceae bacterium]